MYIRVRNHAWQSLIDCKTGSQSYYNMKSFLAIQGTQYALPEKIPARKTGVE